MDWLYLGVMSLATYEQKRKQTKQSIVDSLIKLASIDDVDKLTVGDINAEAGIGRSTFYRYFENKRDLISYIESTILNGIKSKINQYDYNYSVNSSSYESFIKNFLDLIDVHQPTIKVLISDKGDAKFNYQFTKLIQSVGEKGNQYLIRISKNDEIKSYSQYVGGAIAGIIIYWINNYQDCTHEAVFASIMGLKKRQL